MEDKKDQHLEGKRAITALEIGMNMQGNDP